MVQQHLCNLEHENTYDDVDEEAENDFLTEIAKHPIHFVHCTVARTGCSFFISYLWARATFSFVVLSIRRS